MVPRRVRYVSEGHNGTVVLKEWTSDDLGERDCTDDDFTIHVGETTDFAGLSKPIDAIQSRAVRLSDLELADLGDGVFGQVAVPVARPVPLGDEGDESVGIDNRTVLILANLVVILGVIVWMLVRRRMKKGESV